MRKMYGGEELKYKQIKSGDITLTKHTPEARYAWTCGEAISRFLDELIRRKLIARKCNKCDRVLFPPRMFCELCLRPTDEWVYVKDTGVVETFSKSYVDTDAKRVKESILVGVIAPDEASEHMGIMHYFGDMEQEDLTIGVRVKAVWKNKEERRGAITDIKYFRLIKEGENAFSRTHPGG